MKKKIANRPLLVLGFILGFIALLFVGRWLWFYRGWYTAPDIPEIDESQIAPSLVEYQHFEDEPPACDGYVVIDLSHANNLKANDLSPLRDRLEARGVTVETFDDSTNTPLSAQLHRATALLVIAPTEKFTAGERDAIVDFVADGGRLLLAADPTRPVSEGVEEEFPTLYSVLFSTSAVPAANSLASAFGVLYFDDYLYNLNDNAGNYRNVKFTNFGDDHPLTQDIETVVFFAAHSLRSNGLSLIVGDEHTHSPVRSGETNLAAATLTADGRVLALSDVTFLTAPYHTIGDNDRFLSHIADWLAAGTRERDNLEDFPYLFERPVDLVQASGSFLDPQLIARGSELQEFFEQAGLALELRAAAEPGHDALFVGIFDDLDLVQDYLVTAGVTVTAVAPITPSQTPPPAEQAGQNYSGKKSSLVIKPVPPEQAGDTVVKIDPAAAMGTVGATVVLDIKIENVSNLYGAEVHLTFDPTLVEVVDAEPDADGIQITSGTFLAPDFVGRNTVDNTAGKIDYAIAQLPPDSPVNGSGILATITFRGKAEGASDLSFESALLASPDGQAIPSTTQNGSITVGQEEEPEGEEEGDAEEIEKEKEESRIQGAIEIETLGTIGIQGTTLFVIDHGDDRVAVIVLAEDSEAVVAALERLASNDLSGCVQASAVTVCSTGEAQDEFSMEAGSSDKDNGSARVFIISGDNGLDGARTGAAELEAILSESYAVTVWSTTQDGVPTSDDLTGYDVYIIDSGDYDFDVESADVFAALENIESGGIMLVGTRPLPSVGDNYAPISDLRVADPSHPLAAGFASDEVLTLLASESGVSALVISEADVGEAQVIFTRGPDSQESDAPALVAAIDEGENISRVIAASFAFYRLPEDAQRTLALNAVKWLLGTGD